MFRTLLADLVAGSVVSLANAAPHGIIAKEPMSAGIAASRIADPRGNPEPSSVALKINKTVQDVSLLLSGCARAEMTTGPVRTALELTRQHRREQALVSPETADLKHEPFWHAVGVES